MVKIGIKIPRPNAIAYISSSPKISYKTKGDNTAVANKRKMMRSHNLLINNMVKNMVPAAIQPPKIAISKFDSILQLQCSK